MGKMIVTDIEKCTGCGLCELICSFKHHGEFNPAKSRIHKTVFVERAVAIPVVCYQCEEPWCGKICRAEAITWEKDEKTGATWGEVSVTTCVGGRPLWEYRCFRERSCRKMRPLRRGSGVRQVLCYRSNQVRGT